MQLSINFNKQRMYEIIITDFLNPILKKKRNKKYSIKNDCSSINITIKGWLSVIIINSLYIF